ncbi:carbon-nitrogen hydrolase, partial [Nonomuraea sp. MCN248]|nr:carbon-nitrogen hydrolase [Nonomuraea corallina]
ALIVLPEGSPLTAEEVSAAVRDTPAHVVTGAGALVNASGVLTPGAEPCPIHPLPWGRLAIIAGEDARHPEEFRLAALADADVVAVPYTAREPWELRLGLLERAAENRLNVVVAGQDGPDGVAGLILAAPRDFTLWTAWEGPFTGRISHPEVTAVKNSDEVVHAVVRPEQAVNRHVSRGTDLVDGRPWRLAGALLGQEG